MRSYMFLLPSEALCGLTLSTVPYPEFWKQWHPEFWTCVCTPPTEKKNKERKQWKRVHLTWSLSRSMTESLSASLSPLGNTPDQSQRRGWMLNLEYTPHRVVREGEHCSQRTQVFLLLLTAIWRKLVKSVGVAGADSTCPQAAYVIEFGVDLAKFTTPLVPSPARTPGVLAVTMVNPAVHIPISWSRMTFVEPELSDRTMTLTGVPAAWGRMSSHVKELPRPGVRLSKILHKSACERHAVPISAPVTAAIPPTRQILLGVLICSAVARQQILILRMSLTHTHPGIHIISYVSSQIDHYWK